MVVARQKETKKTHKDGGGEQVYLLMAMIP